MHTRYLYKTRKNKYINALKFQTCLSVAMLVWILLAVVPLPGLYDYCPRFRYWLKFSLYYLWLMLASLLIIPLSLTRPGSVDNARLGARMMNPLTKILGIHWKLRGHVELLRLRAPCVIVANHQSSVDLLGMFHIWDRVGRMAAIAKHSLLYYGPFGKHSSCQTTT